MFDAVYSPCVRRRQLPFSGRVYMDWDSFFLGVGVGVILTVALARVGAALCHWVYNTLAKDDE